ncbi:hypothetical protein KAK06_04245 [Ideonella sp. 4Y11]|uniref:Uncharacterized protein n=1 Tax=Ideonella aquatica TaxID=2824119 RepID=A0A940YDG4_9BURK|nr:hypothetical protein [Ideonella aquatica]MBQ0958158.1 hypothetical protein [Ideonella aquatica]
MATRFQWTPCAWVFSMLLLNAADAGAAGEQAPPRQVPPPPVFMVDGARMDELSGRLTLKFVPDGGWTRHEDRNDTVADPLDLKSPQWYVHLREPGLFSTKNWIVPLSEVESVQVGPGPEYSARLRSRTVDGKPKDLYLVLCEKDQAAPASRECLRPRVTLEFRGLSGDGLAAQRLALPNKPGEVSGARERTYLTGVQLRVATDSDLSEFEQRMKAVGQAPVDRLAGMCRVNVYVEARRLVAEPMQGVSGRCGKGSQLRFSRYQANGWLTDQLCDTDKSIRVTGQDETEEVACTMTGQVLQPQLRFSGLNVVIR